MAIMKMKYRSCRSDGERLIYNFFKDKLPDDFIIWNHLLLVDYQEDGKSEKEIDFIVYHKVSGLTIFEVKDWRVDVIRKISPDYIFLNNNRRTTNPYKIVRHQKDFVMNKLEDCETLLDLPRGHLKLSLNTGLIFPFITLNEWNQLLINLQIKDPNNIKMPPEKILFADNENRESLVVDKNLPAETFNKMRCNHNKELNDIELALLDEIFGNENINIEKELNIISSEPISSIKNVEKGEKKYIPEEDNIKYIKKPSKYINTKQKNESEKTLVFKKYDRDIYFNLGELLIKQKRFEDALSAYKSALNLDPADEVIKYKVNYCQIKLKKRNNIDSLKSKQIKISPKRKIYEKIIDQEEKTLENKMQEIHDLIFPIEDLEIKDSIKGNNTLPENQNEFKNYTNEEEKILNSLINNLENKPGLTKNDLLGLLRVEGFEDISTSRINSILYKNTDTFYYETIENFSTRYWYLL